MKKIMKTMVIVMVTAILASICVTAFAAESMTVSAENVTTNAGKEITVNVNLTNNSGVAILRVQVEYDADIMTLKGSTKGDAAKSFDTSMMSTGDNPITLSCTMMPPEDEANKDQANNKTNGQLLSLTFVIADNAKDGAYPVNVTIEKCFDIDNKKVESNAKSAIVTVKSDEKPTVPPASTEPPVTVPPASTDPSTEPPVTVPPVSTDPSTKPPVTNSPKPTETTTTTTTTTEPSTKDRIPQTGDSNVIALVAGVCMIAGVAFVTTRKKDSE